MSRSPKHKLSRTILIIMMLGVVLYAAGGIAQGQGGIVRSSADYVYGQTMRFNLDATDIGEVNAITLFFRLGSSPDSFAVDIEVPTAPEIDVSYALDLTQTRLPPFTAVTYWWELERDDDTLQVPEQVISYVDDQFNWSQLVETDDQGGGGIRFHWTGDNPEIGEQARDITFEMLPRIGRLIPLEHILPFDVYIYPSTEDLGVALRLAGRDYTPGQSYPDLGVVLVTVVNPETAESELRHELSRGLTNLLLYQAFGQFAYRLPPWLTSGLAGNIRDEPDPNLNNALRVALSSNTTIPFADLCDGMPVDNALTAAQSEALVSYVTDNYGTAAVRELVTKFAEGDNCSTAFREVIQLSPEQLGTAWLRTLVSGEGNRSTAEVIMWAGLVVAGFGLAALLLIRPRKR